LAVVTRAVLLAAGRGKRLGSLTADRPKPMIPVHGKPVLEHIIDGLRVTGFDEFLIVVGYRAEAIRDHFGDGAAKGAKITYVEQPTPTGTGVAVSLAREFVRDQPFLCSFGDILTSQEHYRLLMADFTDAPCAAVIGINLVDDPSAGGAVYRDGPKVTRVVEKPPPGTSLSNWNLAGVNVFGPQICEALATVTPSLRGEIEITSAYSALIDAGQEVRAVELHDFWSDVGTPEALVEAERFFVQS